MSWYVNLSTEIRIPREIVNDDVVKIAAWEVAHGSKVTPKQVVAAIETSKAVIDLEAEMEGYLEILHPKGAELPVGELIGRIQSQPIAAISERPDAAGIACFSRWKWHRRSGCRCGGLEKSAGTH